jgi:hypothetical protein
MGPLYVLLFFGAESCIYELVAAAILETASGFLIQAF